MEMTPHLNDREMAELLAAPSSGVDPHLAMCDSCLDEISRLREGLRRLRNDGTRPEEFWKRQERAIDSRISVLNSESSIRWQPLWMAIAVASAALLLAALLPKRAHAPSPDVVSQTQAAIQDHALLVRVEESLAQDGPEAVQPAAILASEISPQDFSASSAETDSVPQGEQHQ